MRPRILKHKIGKAEKGSPVRLPVKKGSPVPADRRVETVALPRALRMGSNGTAEPAAATAAAADDRGNEGVARIGRRVRMGVGQTGSRISRSNSAAETVGAAPAEVGLPNREVRKPAATHETTGGAAVKGDRDSVSAAPGDKARRGVAVTTIPADVPPGGPRAAERNVRPGNVLPLSSEIQGEGAIGTCPPRWIHSCRNRF